MIVYDYIRFFIDLSTAEGMEQLNRLGREGWKLDAVTRDYVILSQRGFDLTPGYSEEGKTG